MPSHSRLWIHLTLIAVLFIIAIPFASPQYPSSWPLSSLFSKTPYRLGLDLKGGAHLVYQADTSKVPEEDRESAINGVRDVIERRINAFGVSEPLVQTNETGGDYRVIVEMAGVFDIDEAIKQIGETPLLEFKTQNPEAGAPLTDEQKKELDGKNATVMQKANDVLAQALAPNADFAALAKEYSEDPGSKDNGGDLGWVTASSTVPEFDRAIFYGLHDGQITPSLVTTQFGYHIIKRIEGRTAAHVQNAPTSSPESADLPTSSPLAEQEVHAQHILFRTTSEAEILSTREAWLSTALTGKQLKRASVQFNQQTGEPNISLEFNNEGADLFAQLTGDNIGKPIAIFLDGEAISIPNVQEKIEGGSAVITGRFTIAEAKQLAARLNAGALPVPITLIAQSTVGPTLGSVSLQASLKAGLIGILLVILFMILYYRLPGMVAVIALIGYTALTLSLFKLIPVTLTLAGIAGFILSIGMAVDANVLIFERLKEELRAGKSLPAAVEEGFKRAWTSIRDSNASSLLTAGILLWFGSSVVKGFAFTLVIGILVSMFSAITVSRTILRLIALSKLQRSSWLFGVSQSASAHPLPRKP